MMRRWNKKLLVLAVTGGMLFQAAQCFQIALAGIASGLGIAISSQFLPLNTILVGDTTTTE